MSKGSVHFLVFGCVAVVAGIAGCGDGTGDDDSAPGASSCDTVRSELLSPVDGVSSGLVEDISEPGDSAITLRVDASAGGFMAAASNPYIYLELAGGTRVDLTDDEADASTAWDLALKRDNLRTNSEDSGPGAGEVAVLDGAIFDEVTAEAADDVVFGRDDFVSDSCEPVVDATGKPLTSFEGWYEYDESTMALSPAPKVFLIRDAAGMELYKLEIVGYYQAIPDDAGGTVQKSAVYTLRYALL